MAIFARKPGISNDVIWKRQFRENEMRNLCTSGKLPSLAPATLNYRCFYNVAGVTKWPQTYT